MDQHPIIAAIDAGGTSFKCALVRRDGAIVSAWSVPTETPDKTYSACAASFRDEIARVGIQPKALGIASFGPVDIDQSSPTYGMILGTAKSGWCRAKIGPALSTALGLPFFLETDVNAALAAEMKWGAALDAHSAAYMTVGTGIGVGIFSNRDFVGRPTHPEFGHIRVARHDLDREFAGVCQIHGDCLEGLASAPAVNARWGDPSALPVNHVGWEIEAYYLAQACLNLYLATRVEKIIIGGGLMQATHLRSLVQTEFDRLIADYLPVRGTDIILPPKLGQHAGVLGGAVVALRALN